MSIELRTEEEEVAEESAGEAQKSGGRRREVRREEDGTDVFLPELIEALEEDGWGQDDDEVDDDEDTWRWNVIFLGAGATAAPVRKRKDPHSVVEVEVVKVVRLVVAEVVGTARLVSGLTTGRLLLTKALHVSVAGCVVIAGDLVTTIFTWLLRTGTWVVPPDRSSAEVRKESTTGLRAGV